jgi:hypothetical protein
MKWKDCESEFSSEATYAGKKIIVSLYAQTLRFHVYIDECEVGVRWNLEEAKQLAESKVKEK